MLRHIKKIICQKVLKKESFGFLQHKAMATTSVFKLSELDKS